MIFIHRHIVLIIVLTVVGFLLLAGTAVLEAWMDTRKRPREKMYWCHVHGYIRKKHLLPLFPDMKKTNGEPFAVCPLCYKHTVYDELNKGKMNGLGLH